MTESPETPTPSLADALEVDATYWRDLQAEQPQRPGYDWMIELADRQDAAAAQLRQLDRIKAAAGDDIEWSVALAVCRELAIRYPSWASDLNLTEALLRRISDALEADDGA